ncbi:hypothetical protein Pmani_027563 [Petrolisthes manimaculis]|uniref:Protein KTI12 homolog n=1 Tax=Petrolisthes manimaculis TaxID=1843537 RepID=A0AAE1P399_9EUCA|nr:hypothetical protein Pmani_027563 [Petrolisthes manimaculis]
MTGFPSSGKTKRSSEIQNYLVNVRDKKVIIVSENQVLAQDKNAIVSDSRKEKDVRGTLKAHVLRALNKEDVVILDAANYIKGYRYELYCASKQFKTTQCLVQSLASIEQAWEWNEARPQNERYTREVFDGLVGRYEAPNSTNRWDSPLVTLTPEMVPDLEALHDILYLSKPSPPNQSTQIQPLSSTNFLHELDRTTQEVSNCIMTAQKTLVGGDAIRVPGVEESLTLGRKVTLAEVTRARRQFISYTKMHPVEDSGKLATLFVKYLNTTLQ